MSKKEEPNIQDYWKRIKPGWTEEQVRSLLGAPDAIKDSGLGQVTWKYGQWPLHGTVTFADGIVVGYKCPFLDDAIRW